MTLFSYFSVSSLLSPGGTRLSLVHVYPVNNTTEDIRENRRPDKVASNYSWISYLDKTRNYRSSMRMDIS